MHRLRIKFGCDRQLKFLSHLDMMRLWERALRRAGVAPAYSEGFSPHPRISLAVPLAVGVTSRAEVMDIFMEQRLSPDYFRHHIAPQLPDGITVVEVTPVSIQSPSLQSRVRFAEYEVEVETTQSTEELQDVLKVLLSKAQLPWHHTRDTGVRYYDLRPLISDLLLVESDGKSAKIGMRLRCDASGTGRPEQVVKALGYENQPVSIERTKLIFA